MPPSVPCRFGKYILVERIHESAGSELYLAYLEEPGRPDHPNRWVALKMLRTPPKAPVIHPLKHPNIVHFRESGEFGSQAYSATDWIQGKNLREILDKSAETGDAIPDTLAVTIILEVAKALHYVHSLQDPETGQALGIAHGNLSPQKIMVSYDGHVKLTQFETGPNGVHRESAYPSPEGVIGQKPDSRSDIFSLGAILYEALTGKRAFDGESNLVIAEKVKYCDNFMPPLDLAAIPPALKEVLRCCFQKEPARRFDSVDAFFNPLASVIAGDYATTSTGNMQRYMEHLFEKEILREVEKRSKARNSLLTHRPPPVTFSLDAEPPAAEKSATPFQSIPDVPELDARDTLKKEPLSPKEPSRKILLEEPVALTHRQHSRPAPARDPSTLQRQVISAGVAILIATGLYFLTHRRSAEKNIPAPSSADSSAVSRQAPAPQRIRFEILPQGGTAPSIFLNGKPLSARATAEFPANTPIELTVIKKGFQVFKKHFTTAANPSSEMIQKVLMEPVSFGILSIKTRPNAQVEISSKQFSWNLPGPIERLRLPPGDYRIRFRNRWNLYGNAIRQKVAIHGMYSLTEPKRGK